jgi:hypothetical protein
LDCSTCAVYLPLSPAERQADLGPIADLLDAVADAGGEDEDEADRAA